MSLDLPESDTFRAARLQYEFAVGHFRTALSAETERLIKAITPEAKAVEYNLEPNEDLGLTADITNITDAQGDPIEIDDLMQEMIAPKLAWLDDLDGMSPTNNLSFFV